ncbi:hypothetical protein ABK040_015501 [Willaertia magna]
MVFKKLRESLMFCLPSNLRNSSTRASSTTINNTNTNNTPQVQNEGEAYTLKHINVQCYCGRFPIIDGQLDKLQHPKKVMIEWVFDECILIRPVHRVLKSTINNKNTFSDITILTDSEHDEEATFNYEKIESYSSKEKGLLISEGACSLIPCLKSRIEQGRLQTMELQIPYSFHFAIDYPEDESRGVKTDEKVTLEGYVIFSISVIHQILEWCEHYYQYKEFEISDLEGRGMLFCCNNKSYFKTTVGEWHWDFLEGLDKNMLLQVLIMSHILSIHPLLLLIKTKIMFDVKTKCREAAARAGLIGGFNVSQSILNSITRVQFLNYFIESSLEKRRKGHGRTSSFDKIRGLTSSPAICNSDGYSRLGSSLSDQEKCSPALIKEEPKEIARLGDHLNGFVHFLKVK